MSETSAIKPLVTIVIPVFNKANTVVASIASCKAQTVSNFKAFVVNDGSTDNSEEVILEAIKDDPRFHYIDQENQGVAAARNTGVLSGDAPFVVCLDSDDQIAPLFLQVCIEELEKDPSLGIAYTGLWAVEPDGKQGLSPWPGVFDYDRALTGANQIPTCNVSRREIWERLGGQRSRYCLSGAGEEDAEMWLRAGAMGFGAKKVTDAGLFIYAWKSGQVSGDRSHRISPYRSWHPWVEDGDHPFASVATPKRFSHKVRQYDEPVVSVIIPLASRHISTVIDALDSLESQTFRQWEVIIVDDTALPRDNSWRPALERNYPFVTIIDTYGKGAGAARNAGAKAAKAPFLLFLDADDFIAPDCIQSMLDTWGTEKAIIYSDYIGRVICEKKWAEDTYKGHLIDYYERQGEAAIRFQSEEYYCDHAVAQPRPFKNNAPYIWCLIIALIPKAWHDEVGGFDEQMISWEDWDYWIRLAKAGKCFVRIPKALVMYRFYSGERREAGLQSARPLIQYLERKYEGVKIMACGCNQKNAVQQSRHSQTFAPQQDRSQELNAVQDKNMILCIYTTPSRGDHRVMGGVTGFDYGYRSQGQRFLVDKRDIDGQPFLFKPIAQPTETIPMHDEPVVETPPPTMIVIEEPTDRETVVAAFTGIYETIVTQSFADTPVLTSQQEDDLQTVPGLSAIHAQMLNAAGVHSYQELIDFGSDNLKKFKGIGETRAEQIIEYAKKKVSGTL